MRHCSRVSHTLALHAHSCLVRQACHRWPTHPWAVGAKSHGGFVTRRGTRLAVLQAGVWAQAAWSKLPSQPVYIHSLHYKAAASFFKIFGCTPWHVGSYFPTTRDRTHAPCLKRQSLNHWTATSPAMKVLSVMNKTAFFRESSPQIQAEGTRFDRRYVLRLPRWCKG